jgi:competence protein ComEA
MKSILFAMVTLFAASALAQMPNAEALKNQAEQTQTSTKTLVEKTTTTVKEVEQKALVNLNTASAADLAKLPGIGPTRAQAIIAARPYNSVSDLKKVKGIKEGVIAKIKGLVTVK